MAIVFNGQFQGLADSRFSGVAGSFAESIGINGHSTPGILKVHQALKKDSGSTVDAFVKVAIAVSTGYSFWFSSTSGKIWARSSGDTWTLAHTTTPAAGGAGCLGAMEYNGYVYWATESRLHRIAIADADDSWASEAEDWATFAVTDASFHPMAIQDLTLFIGDGNRVVSVNSSGTFDNNALDIKTPLRIKSMIDYELDILIGTYVADTVNKTEIIRWDTTSTSWNTSDPIEEVGINAFIRDDNYVYVNAGRAGNLYFYNGEQLILFKKIPGDYSPTKYGEVYPGSVANYQGRPIFGFSNGLGNSTKQGIFTLGSYSRDYPKVLDLSFPISERSAGELVTTGLEIGGVLVLDFLVLCAWKNGSSYGVDVLDYDNKLEKAYFETMMLRQGNRADLETLGSIKALYNSLPSGTSFKISYSKNGGAYVEITEDFDNAILNAWEAPLTVSEVGSLQIKVEFIVNGNDSPDLEALDLTMK